MTHIDPDGALDGWIPTGDGATVLSEPVGAMTWFPNNNTPWDKATFDVAVNVPKDLEVAGNGDLTSRTRHGSTTTWHWQQRRPMATYLAMISIGAVRRLPLDDALDHRQEAADLDVRRSEAGRADGAARRAAGDHPVRGAQVRAVPADQRRPGGRGHVGRLLAGDPEPAGLRRGAEPGPDGARVGPPVVRRLRDPEGLGRHLAERGLRDVRRVAVGGRERRAEHGGGVQRARWRTTRPPRSCGNRRRRP